MSFNRWTVGAMTLALVISPFGMQPSAVTEETAVFAGGCFWGVEWVFEHLRGVKSATSGYAGGTTASPSYDEVSTGATGHAESVRVVYDPTVISYRQLLEVFFLVAHDPTTRDHQGPDFGTEYRPIVFYQNAAQQRWATAYVEELTASRNFRGPIVTEIRALKAFYPAEAYHQDYAAHHPDQPYIVFNDLPKIEHLRKQFPALFKPLPTD